MKVGLVGQTRKPKEKKYSENCATSWKTWKKKKPNRPNLNYIRQKFQSLI